MFQETAAEFQDGILIQQDHLDRSDPGSFLWGVGTISLDESVDCSGFPFTWRKTSHPCVDLLSHHIQFCLPMFDVEVLSLGYLSLRICHFELEPDTAEFSISIGLLSDGSIDSDNGF